MRDAEEIQFLQWCLPRLQLSWPGYRRVRRQVYKRISRRLQALGLQSFADYQTYLDAHPEEWMILDTYCWIPISRFYRDKGVFQFLGQEVLPQLARQVSPNGECVLRCWSLGCASGEEPHSLAILWKLSLAAQFPTVRLLVLATDVDAEAITRAQYGCYTPSSLRDLPDAWRSLAFEMRSEGYCIKPEFQDPVTFLVQDIRKAAPDERFDLVLCRYMAFTYFDEALQQEILQNIVDRMRLGGALVVGTRERLPKGDFGLIPWVEKWGVFKRKETTT